MTDAKTEPSVTDLTATAVLELARLGRVTDETYDALKTAVEPAPASDDDVEPAPASDDDDDQGDDQSDKTDATKAAGARKATSR